MLSVSVLDEFTRVALALVPGRSLTSAAVKGVLARLFARQGRPKVIRSDNGPEFLAFELVEWLESLGAETYHIEPGKPWQNGCGESFHARLRDAGRVRGGAETASSAGPSMTDSTTTTDTRRFYHSELF